MDDIIKGPNVWLAKDASAEGSALPTFSRSPSPAPVDYLTRLDHALTRIEASQQRQEGMLMKMIEALSKDDPDEVPTTYLSGRPI